MRNARGKYLLLALVAVLTTGAYAPDEHYPSIDSDEYQDASDWFESGLAFNGEGRYNDAAQAFGKVVSIDPENAFAWMNLGTMQALVGEFDSAIGSLRKAVKFAPSLAQAYANLGEVCFRAGRFSEAIDAYRDLLLLWPDNAYAHYKRGLAFLFVDNLEGSQEEYRLLKDLDGELAGKLLHALEQAKQLQ